MDRHEYNTCSFYATIGTTPGYGEHTTMPSMSLEDFSALWRSTTKIPVVVTEGRAAYGHGPATGEPLFIITGTRNPYWDHLDPRDHPEAWRQRVILAVEAMASALEQTSAQVVFTRGQSFTYLRRPTTPNPTGRDT